MRAEASPVQQAGGGAPRPKRAVAGAVALSVGAGAAATLAAALASMLVDSVTTRRILWVAVAVAVAVGAGIWWAEGGPTALRPDSDRLAHRSAPGSPER